MSNPKISVVIPVYNRELTIARCLDSVLKQSYSAHQILVVDDGSADGTHAIISAYGERDPRVKCLYQINSGVAVARNLAIESATGDWIAFLDSDDVWLTEKLKHAVDVIDRDPCVEFIHAEKRYLFEDGRDDGRNPFPAEEMTNREYLFSHWAMKTSTVLIKRDLMERLGTMFLAELETGSDYELFWRAIAEAKALGYAQSVDTEITMSSGSLIRRDNELQLIVNNIFGIDSAARWIEAGNYPSGYAEALRTVQYWQFRTLFLAHMRRGRFAELVRALTCSVRQLSLGTTTRAYSSACLGVIQKVLRGTNSVFSGTRN